MGKILPLLLALIGLGGGVGAGLMLRPEPEPVVSIDPCGDGSPAPVRSAVAEPEEDDEPSTTEFVKINNQFVIPVMKGGSVAALVVMAISVEVEQGSREGVYQREPKLRDAFLQVLFDHANAGGFDGAFTAGPNMQTLRTALTEVARGLLGPMVVDVLITDIARQDT
tara:strand:- start:6551 stop:7051 length:501 start_codon:yes stop_codon:yes gene_type:complete